MQNQVPAKAIESEEQSEEFECDPAHSSDVLDHYRFIMLIRDQFLRPDPFKNPGTDMKCKKFKRVFDNLEYHYTQMMTTFDSLTNEAKEIMSIYKENV